MGLVTTWTDEDSLDLTATMIVVDRVRLNGNALNKDELRATLALAHRLKVRRSEVAERIGWNKNRLWKWAKDHQCAWSEADFPDEPLRWLTQAAAGRITATGGRTRPRLRRG